MRKSMLLLVGLVVNFQFIIAQNENQSLTQVPSANQKADMSYSVGVLGLPNVDSHYLFSFDENTKHIVFEPINTNDTLYIVDFVYADRLNSFKKEISKVKYIAILNPNKELLELSKSQTKDFCATNFDKRTDGFIQLIQKNTDKAYYISLISSWEIMCNEEVKGFEKGMMANFLDFKILGFLQK